MTLTLCLFCNAADPGPDPDPEEVTLGAGAEVEAVVGPLEESVGVAAGTEWPATIQATSHAVQRFNGWKDFAEDTLVAGLMATTFYFEIGWS